MQVNVIVFEKISKTFTLKRLTHLLSLGNFTITILVDFQTNYSKNSEKNKDFAPKCKNFIDLSLFYI